MNWRPFTWVCRLTAPSNWVWATALKHCFIRYLVWVFVVLRIRARSSFLHAFTNPMVFRESIFLTIFANWKYRLEITYSFVFAIGKWSRGLCTKILFFKAIVLNYVLVGAMFAKSRTHFRLSSLTLLLDWLKKLSLVDRTWIFLITFLVLKSPRHTCSHWITAWSFTELAVFSVLTRPEILS